MIVLPVAEKQEDVVHTERNIVRVAIFNVVIDLLQHVEGCANYREELNAGGVILRLCPQGVGVLCGKMFYLPFVFIRACSDLFECFRIFWVQFLFLCCARNLFTLADQCVAEAKQCRNRGRLRRQPIARFLRKCSGFFECCRQGAVLFSEGREIKPEFRRAVG